MRPRPADVGIGSLIVIIIIVILMAARVQSAPAAAGVPELTLQMVAAGGGVTGGNRLVRFVCVVSGASRDDGLRLRVDCPMLRGGGFGVCYENCARSPLCGGDPVCAASACEIQARAGGFSVGYSFFGPAESVSGEYNCRYRALSQSLLFNFTAAVTTAVATATTATSSSTATTTTTTATTTAAASETTTATTATAAAKATATSPAVATTAANSAGAAAAESTSESPPPRLAGLGAIGRDNLILFIIIFLSLLIVGLIALLVTLFICQRRSAPAAAPADPSSKSLPQAVPNVYSPLDLSDIYEELQPPTSAVPASAAVEAEAALVVELPDDMSSDDDSVSLSQQAAAASAATATASGAGHHQLALYATQGSRRGAMGSGRHPSA